MKSKRGFWLPVVTGIIRRGSKVLVGQRPEGHTLAGLWEFPGGKIEKGESPEEALRRELQEELGIEADISQVLLASSHTYGDTGILLIFFEVLYWKGEPKPIHHQQLRWIHPSELLQLEIPDANRKIIDRIIQVIH